MKSIFFFIIIIFSLQTLVPLGGAEMGFHQVAEWRPAKEPILVRIVDSFVDADHHIVMWLEKGQGMALVKPDAFIPFAKRGDGPGEINIHTAMCPLPEKRLAIFDLNGRVKIFSKVGGVYQVLEKEGTFFKNNRFGLLVRGAAFLQNKWVLTGLFMTDQKPDLSYSFTLFKTFDDKGRLIAELPSMHKSGPDGFLNLEHRVLSGNSTLWAMSEHELRVRQVSAEPLAVVKEKLLEAPPAYTPMPADFYTYKNYTQPGVKGTFSSDTAYWEQNYSRVLQTFFTGEYFIVQILTPGKTSRYALLFYDKKTLALRRVTPVSDYLLGVRDDLYYFYAGGNPGFEDDEDGECRIRVCRWK